MILGRLVLLAAVAAGLSAEEKWVEFRSGPIQVFTNAGDREGRATLTAVEQLRFVLGEVTGKKDLKATWPIRIVLTKNGTAALPAVARDALVMPLAPSPDLPPAIIKELTKQWLVPNTPGLPPVVARGLPELFSTLRVAATHVTLGTPPPPAERDEAWALLHLLAVDSRYAGRLRVFLSNAANGMDLETASKNAFEKPLAALQNEAREYLRQGRFGTASAVSRPISPERDFPARPLSGRQARLAQADLLLAAKQFGPAQAAYKALEKEYPDTAEPHEGQGLALAGLKQTAVARDELLAAVQKNSASARAYQQLASLETELAEKRTYLQKATELNPAWDQAWYEWAQIEKDPRRKAPLLGKAASAAPGHSDYWQEYALALEGANDFTGAAKAWSAAERAVSTEPERQKIREARVNADRLRLESDVAARRKAEEDRERDIQRAKDNAMAEIRNAEEKANRGAGASSGQAAVRYEDLDSSGSKVSGDLIRIDCVGARWKMVVASAPGKSVSLLVSNPAPFADKLACGVQKPVRKVMIEYSPKRDPKSGTAGEVTAVEFR